MAQESRLVAPVSGQGHRMALGQRPANFRQHHSGMVGLRRARQQSARRLWRTDLRERVLRSVAYMLGPQSHGQCRQHRNSRRRQQSETQRTRCQRRVRRLSQLGRAFWIARLALLGRSRPRQVRRRRSSAGWTRPDRRFEQDQRSLSPNRRGVELQNPAHGLGPAQCPPLPRRDGQVSHRHGPATYRVSTSGRVRS